MSIFAITMFKMKHLLNAFIIITALQACSHRRQVFTANDQTQIGMHTVNAYEQYDRTNTFTAFQKQIAPFNTTDSIPPKKQKRKLYIHHLGDNYYKIRYSRDSACKTCYSNAEDSQGSGSTKRTSSAKTRQESAALVNPEYRNDRPYTKDQAENKAENESTSNLNNAGIYSLAGGLFFGVLYAFVPFQPFLALCIVGILLFILLENPFNTF